jgi:small subunit ribosomal protein S13
VTLRREVHAPIVAARLGSAATRASGTAAACPVRGQRTHTNARTRKGPRKTVAGKKKAECGLSGTYTKQGQQA